MANGSWLVMQCSQESFQLLPPMSETAPTFNLSNCFPLVNPKSKQKNHGNTKIKQSVLYFSIPL
jgi:hypothetical protein